MKYPSYELRFFAICHPPPSSLWSEPEERDSAQTRQRVFCLWTGSSWFFESFIPNGAPACLAFLPRYLSILPTPKFSFFLSFFYPPSTIPPLTSSFPFHRPERSLFFFCIGPCHPERSLPVPKGTMHFKAALIPHGRVFLSFSFSVVLFSAGLINEPDSGPRPCRPKPSSVPCYDPNTSPPLIELNEGHRPEEGVFLLCYSFRFDEMFEVNPLSPWTRVSLAESDDIFYKNLQVVLWIVEILEREKVNYLHVTIQIWKLF